MQKRGFTIDFNLKKNGIGFKDSHFFPNEFEIVECYHFEGDSDPADEAVVYGVESKGGLKGILVNGYGISSETLTNEMTDKLKFHH